jgi:hypothetical protein
MREVVGSSPGLDFILAVDAGEMVGAQHFTNLRDHGHQY